jgi:hypothetical protein
MLGTLLKWFGGKGCKKGRDENVNDSSPRLSKLYEGDRGIGELAAHDAELRLWLPSPLKSAMGECADEMDVTVAKYLREFLVVYLYGAHELLRMKAERSGLYYAPPPSPPPSDPFQSSASGIKFSRAPAVDCIPGLGKNIVPVKLHLHEKLKSDLENLAMASGIPLGQFVREILASHFLGHTVWAERKRGWTERQQKIADDWEAERDEEQDAQPSDEDEAVVVSW